MHLTLSEIAAALGTPVLGDGSLVVTGLAEPAQAGAGDLALAMSPRYADGLAQGKARAAVLWEGADWQALGLDGAVTVGRGRLAMAQLTSAADTGPDFGTGIHPTALVEADLPAGCVVGPFTHIAKGAQIGPGARIGGHVTIAGSARIGRDAVIHAGARIGARVTIGDRVRVNPNAVIGADGLSFVTEDPSAVELARASLGDTGAAAGQVWHRIHSLGGVVIGDDVEIGATSCIDYGTIRDTTVGNGTKIDNQVHIAHNARIGRHCLFAAGVGIAGSTSVGDFCVFGGQVGVGDNLTIGDRVIAGGGSKILSNVPADRVIQGYPAVKMETYVDSYKALRRLPRIMEKLQKAVSKPDHSE